MPQKRKMNNRLVSQESNPLTNSILATGRRDYSIGLHRDAISSSIPVPLYCQETQPFHRQEMVPGIAPPVLGSVYSSRSKTQHTHSELWRRITPQTEYNTCTCTVPLSSCVVCMSKPEKAFSATSGVTEEGVHVLQLDGIEYVYSHSQQMT